MRKVSGPPSGAEYDYTPEVDGDPIVVRLRIPTEADKRRFGRGFRSSIKFDDSGEAVKDSEGNVAVEIDDSIADRWRCAMLTDCVISVRDYADNRGKPIETGADLFEHGEAEIVNLVVAEIQTGYTMSDGKKSASSELSDSQPVTSPPSDGTVKNAESDGLISSGVVVEDPSLKDQSSPELGLLTDAP